MTARSEQAFAVPTQRLWRLRKLHEHIDARIRDHGAAGAELQYFHNGDLIYTRSWDRRDDAAAEAAAKRVELERCGWTAHW